ncbi:hypothetical protein BJ165DRAFT_1605909 [Panaeolus papilionaceus]|nr:hypothetical protein BJ165DRAFT_1605909 [Panaeolus papilionaceus]
MKLNLYSLLFAAVQLSLLVTTSNALYADDSLDDMFRRDSGLNILSDHYLRSFHDSPLADISTRELVYELESRLERRETGATGTGSTANTAAKKDDGKGGAATGQQGAGKEPTVEQLNKSLKKVAASKNKQAKEAAQAIRKMIKTKGGVPYDEAAGGKGGAVQGGAGKGGANGAGANGGKK